MKYRKKPVVIEAWKWTGSDRVFSILKNAGLPWKRKCLMTKTLYLNTLEGVMEARVGDYIIRGIEGEFYPCKSDIFHKTYEEEK